MSLSHRNQSIDWFLCERDIDRQRVNLINPAKQVVEVGHIQSEVSPQKLALQRSMSLSHRNQSIDWFLCERDIDRQRVNLINPAKQVVEVGHIQSERLSSSNQIPSRKNCAPQKNEVFG